MREITHMIICDLCKEKMNYSDWYSQEEIARIILSKKSKDCVELDICSSCYKILELKLC